MKNQLIFCLVVLSAAAATGCGRPEIPQSKTSAVTVDSNRSEDDIAAETLDRMLEVARAGDWEAYVDDYYGEQHKFRSTTDRDALVRRFEEKWGEKLVKGLSRAADLPVRIDGDKAKFLDGDDAVFVLHRGETGGWKFHL